jgi:hypothetical protein
LPAAKRKRPAWLLGAWWTCWILGWLTGYQHRGIVLGIGMGYRSTSSSSGIYFDGTRLSALLGAVDAVLLAIIVRGVSTGPVGGALRVSEPGFAGPTDAVG